MRADVVKSNSKSERLLLKYIRLALLASLCGLSFVCIEKISFYIAIRHTCPVALESISWENPHVFIAFSSKNKKIQTLHIEKIPYLSITSKEHFEALKPDIKNKITQGYYQINNPCKVYLFRPFPFKYTIYLGLLMAFYGLFLIGYPLLKTSNLKTQCLTVLKKISH